MKDLPAELSPCPRNQHVTMFYQTEMCLTSDVSDRHKHFHKVDRTSATEAGPVPRTQLQAPMATLNSIRWLGLDRYRYRVSSDTRQYRWVSVSANTYLSIGADTSSPVIRLPVSTVNTVARMPIVSSLYCTKNNACSCISMSFSIDNVTKNSLPMHTICTFQNIMTLCFETYVMYDVYVCPTLWVTSFPVSVSVSEQLRPIVSGIRCNPTADILAANEACHEELAWCADTCQHQRRESSSFRIIRSWLITTKTKNNISLTFGRVTFPAALPTVCWLSM